MNTLLYVSAGTSVGFMLGEHSGAAYENKKCRCASRRKICAIPSTSSRRCWNTGQPLPRLIFACDEVAEMLDRIGADNERKKLLSQIENRLTTIARQGRAFGLHLILATQRPDATIIPGQIRNNTEFRVCGRADSVLSQIILDNTSAAEQIPKDARGPLFAPRRHCIPSLLV